MFVRRPEACGPARAAVRGVIDAVTSEAGLIPGRFAAGRKVVRDALREELRGRNDLPILFAGHAWLERGAGRRITG